MFVYAFLIFLVAAVSSIIVMLAFGQNKNEILRRIVTTALIGSVVCFSLCMIIGFSGKEDCARCVSKYEDLMLYYTTVNNSTNEYVRYNYYDKVQDYNEYYTRLVGYKDDFWIGNLVDESWLDGCGLIDFQLHGDGYGEGY